MEGGLAVPEHRRIALSMYMTLDGYNEFPSYPGSGDPPASETDPVSEQMWTKRWGTIDTLLFDRQTYDQWAEFWPISKRTAEEHPWYRQMSEFAESAQKVVLADSQVPTSWRNSRVIEGDFAMALSRLKRERGKKIVVVAPGLGMELARRGLIDEYFFAVLPVILGKGNRFFGELENQQTLRLVEVQHFKAGELFLHYETVR
jgi:dihydrofolate reductase